MRWVVVIVVVAVLAAGAWFLVGPPRYDRCMAQEATHGPVSDDQSCRPWWRT